MHGLLVGAAGWTIAEGARGQVTATRAVDSPAFPFPHRVELRIGLRPGRLDIRTTVVPTSRRAVPVAFGWHPYLRVPGATRARWRLVLPARVHLPLNGRGLPTGDRIPVAAEAAPIGRRTFDDLYAFGRQRVLSLETDEAAVSVQADLRYPYAQVWVPPGRPFAALEPMTVPTNALVDGDVPLVAPGDAFSTSFAVGLR